MAEAYVYGLLTQERGKANMERMQESSSSQIEYARYQQFITHSPWSAEDVIAHVRRDVSAMIQSHQSQSNRSRGTGLLLDESGHRKSGAHSVGVARQYLGHLGKVDNGQSGSMPPSSVMA